MGIIIKWCTIVTMMYKNKKVVIVGGSGFIGTQLAKRLLKEGAEVIILDPTPSALNEVTYIKTDLKTVPGFDAIQNPFAVFNLAGVPIFGKWNKEYKEKVYTSRIDTVRKLVKKFEDISYKPNYFISTSAIGVYGDRGRDMLDENSKTIPNTYLAQVAIDWEQEAFKAKELGVQVRIIRNAHVLGKGGILGVLKKIFITGLGGTLGRGEQYMSFVSIEKCIEAYIEAPFNEEEIKNAVSIEPVTNKFFSKRLASLLNRPCWFRIPLWSIRLLYGEFANEIMTSQRVYTAYNPEFEDVDTIIEKNL